MENQNLDKAIENFLAAAQSKVDASYKEMDPIFHRVLSAKKLKKYYRVMSKDKTNTYGYVYCFIDSDGNVLKAATFQKPAKGIRSNIFNADFGASGVTEHGTVYFK